MKRLIILLCLVAMPLFLFGQEKEQGKPDPQHRVKIGEMAPDFTLQYTDGSTRKLSDLRGKVVMLQFTASWCSVCMKEMPFIEKEIWAKNKNNKDFVLVGIDFKEDKATIAKFIKAAGISYPLLLDPQGAIFEKYAEKDAGVTRNVIIDRDGRIVYLTRLFDRKEFDGMKGVIQERLGQIKN